MSEVYSFGLEPVNCHAWNKERTQIALSLNNNEVQIHALSGGKWTQTDTLKEHSQRVTGLDWGAKTNRIVTCAADCNAYVWTKQSNGEWKPALVVLRINRGATCVKWSPLENKFAVGSSARSVSVCYYDSENDWWISKQIKKPIRSTVTCIDWHPNNMLVACGSSDFKTRVFSAYIKEIDDKAPSTNWGGKPVFAAVMQEFASASGGGWVHGVRFNSSGDMLAWVSHDSSVSVVDAADGMKLTTVKTEFLPFIDIIWISDTSLVAAGFECSPVRFTYNGQTITVVSKLDADSSKQPIERQRSAMSHFKTLDSKAATDAVDSTIGSVHQNTITWLANHTGSKDKCTKFTTSGSDGQLVVWEVK